MMPNRSNTITDEQARGIMEHVPACRAAMLIFGYIDRLANHSHTSFFNHDAAVPP